MAQTTQTGTAASVAADAAATTTVTFPTAFASAPVVSLALLNPSAWDGYQLSVAIVGTPTTTGFTMIVSGGAPASTISVQWTAIAGATVVSNNSTTPQGYSGASAVLMVQDNTDEYNLPTTDTILRFLNKGLEEVERILNGIFLWGQYPTVPLQTYVHLNDDIQYIESANFSSGAANSSGTITNSSPLSQGSLVYPMVQLEQATFMDAAAGFPAVGFGPPQAFFIYRDQGSSPSNTVVTPDAPILGLVTGTSTPGTISVVQTYVNANGETVASAAASQVITATQQAIVTSPKGTSNANGYNVYVLYSGLYWLQNSTPIALGVPYTIPGTPLTSGTNPPATNTATGSGTGGAMFMQLYPAAMLGQVNVYYRARPQLWADTTSNSWTNLDTSMQEAVILFATMRVLYNRSRGDEAKQLWEPQYKDMIASLQESAMRRTRPPSGRVRDVTNRNFPDFPIFMRG